MRNIVLFVEDYGHESVIRTLIQRFSQEKTLQVSIVSRSVRGGHGKAVSELKTYLRSLEQGKGDVPDLLVVAIDANCRGYTERKREVDEVNDQFQGITICAIPDPHIERWLLLDSSAFKAVLGKGCAAPNQKCSKDRYKQLLIESIRNAGVSPLLGGIEHAEDIVNALDLTKMEQADASLGRFLKELKSKFNEWTA
ncbi:MAG: DUF4276 family protein [Nitrospirae bacterium]|nr:DUF4276 family protein [Nitrospirota bacterium]